MIRAGQRVAYRFKDNIVLPVGCDLGQTEVIYSKGQFQVWRSRSTSIWDARVGERIVMPAAYRIVKRLPCILAMVNGRAARCRLAFVMRVVVAHVTGWRGVRDELVGQVDMLGKRKLKVSEEQYE